MKISFVTTVVNEEKNIELLLESLYLQSKKPDEIIIVDGGSKDRTLKIIEDFVFKKRSKKFLKSLKIIKRKGNRSIGRNEGTRRAKGEIVVLSDSGCILHKDYVKNIIIPFENPEVDVVAGYYKGKYKNIFEKSLVPYVLIMPDKINPINFLPSARAMAFRKTVWKKAGGFPEKFSDNEDYVFSKILKRENFKIYFKKNAFVYYLPRENIVKAIIMFFRFARGDTYAGILRPKVFFIFVKFFIFLWIAILSFYISEAFMLQTISYILIVYILWAIFKNYKYVNDLRAFIYLPLLQISSDLAVFLGSIAGFIESLWDIQVRR